GLVLGDGGRRTSVLGRVRGALAGVHVVVGLVARVLQALRVADAVGAEVVGRRRVEDALLLSARDASIGRRGGAGVNGGRSVLLGGGEPRVEVGRRRAGGVEALPVDNRAALLLELLGEVVRYAEAERLLVVPDRHDLHAERVIRVVRDGRALERVRGGDAEVVVLARGARDGVGASRSQRRGVELVDRLAVAQRLGQALVRVRGADQRQAGAVRDRDLGRSDAGVERTDNSKDVLVGDDVGDVLGALGGVVLAVDGIVVV